MRRAGHRRPLARDAAEETGTRFVFPSDEFYLAAGRPLPEDGEYEDYEQIDDGVGMTADEVKTNINQVAFSGAKSFLEEYAKNEDQENAGIIGHFGLGFIRRSWWPTA